MATSSEPKTYRMPYLSDISPELFYQLPRGLREILVHCWGKRISVEELQLPKDSRLTGNEEDVRRFIKTELNYLVEIKVLSHYHLLSEPREVDS